VICLYLRPWPWIFWPYNHWHIRDCSIVWRIGEQNSDTKSPLHHHSSSLSSSRFTARSISLKNWPDNNILCAWCPFVSIMLLNYKLMPLVSASLFILVDRLGLLRCEWSWIQGTLRVVRSSHQSARPTAGDYWRRWPSEAARFNSAVFLNFVLSHFHYTCYWMNSTNLSSNLLIFSVLKTNRICFAVTAINFINVVFLART